MTDHAPASCIITSYIKAETGLGLVTVAVVQNMNKDAKGVRVVFHGLAHALNQIDYVMHNRVPVCDLVEAQTWLVVDQRFAAILMHPLVRDAAHDAVEKGR